MDFIEYFQFRRRYFPVFIGVIFSALVAGGMVAGLGLLYVFRDIPVSVITQWFAGFVLVYSMLLTHFNFMVIRGRPAWVWGTVALLLFCLLFSLMSMEYRSERWRVVLGVFFSLFGLFLLSTDRHSEMRQILVRERHEREAVKEASKDQRQLEKKRKAYRARRLKARQLKRK
jgi:sensor histidine kinase YesM